MGCEANLSSVKLGYTGRTCGGFTTAYERAASARGIAMRRLNISPSWWFDSVLFACSALLIVAALMAIYSW
jgi:hypothetical protein